MTTAASMLVKWSYTVMDTNTLCHTITGNRRRLGYKLAMWNSRKGLIAKNSDSDSSKLIDIKLFVEKHNPHLFGIIESDLHSPNSRIHRHSTYNTEEVKSKLKIDGYKIELPDSWEYHGQARILVYVRDDVNYTRKTMLVGNDLPNVTLEIGVGKEKKTIVNYFYREWTGGISGENCQVSQINRLERQRDYWETLYNQNKDVICLGDANLCALSWHESNYDASKKVLANIVQEHLLEVSSYQIVEQFTRSEINRNGISRSCLDHVYTNSPAKCEKPKVIPAGDSDHLAVIVDKFSKESPSKPQAVLKRSYKHFNPVSFLQDIQNSCIDEAVTACGNLEEAATVFQELFGHVLDRHAPRKVFQTRKHYVPFLSEETKLLMAERDALKEEATKNGDEELLLEYRKLRNLIKRNIRNDEKNYYKVRFSDIKMTSKQAWKLAYDMLGKVQNKSPTKISYQNQIVSKPRELAKAFNEIFKEKVDKLRNKTTEEPKIDPVVRLESWLSQKPGTLPEFELEPIDKLKLRKLMKKLKPSRSHGVDFLDSYSLKLAFPLIEDSILHLVNLSVSSKLYSEKWKFQLILPLHKKQDTMDGANYRPVSHIVEVGKIVEYVVHEQVYNHFINNNLFHGNHHGFLGNHSTASALIQLYDMWLSAAENKELSAALLLDLSAAFDLVDHSIFLRKLKAYNFSDYSIQWFKSYLEKRVQIIQVETKFSDPESLGNFAVPQGSILGPLIFLIFNNDFPASAIEGESVLYADDDTDNVADKNIEELAAKIQREADRSTDWVQDNRMVCSGSKTKLLVIGTAQLRQALHVGEHSNIEINVCGSRVKDTRSERLLGLTVNNKMTWSDYLQGERWRTENNQVGLIPQLSQRVGILSRLSSLMPKEKFKLFCNGLFHSKLIYCLEVFSHVWNISTYDEEQRRFPAFTRSDNRKLQVLQNRVMRLKSNLPFGTSTVELCRTTGDLSVHQLSAFSTLVTAHKSIISKQPQYLARRLHLRTKQEHPFLPNRHENTLRIQSNLTISRGGFLHRSSVLYNQLPHEFRSEKCSKIFKTKVKEWVKMNITPRPG